MENVQIAHMTFLLHFCPFSREELVAEYLKQNPEQQGLGEAEDQGGQRIAGQGKTPGSLILQPRQPWLGAHSYLRGHI